MEDNSNSFRCLVVQQQSEQTSCGLTKRTSAELPPGEVTVRITHSSLNYKDALCCSGHPGVAKALPLIPGIDAAGEVIASESTQYQVGQKVMIFHAKFGTEIDGGYTERTRVPSDWIYPIPEPLDGVSAMTIGTAGFTAAQCVDYLQRHGVRPESGPIVVSGATGGVGIFAVKLLSRLNYKVVASTGKMHKEDWLKSHGATNVIHRDELNDESGKPLLRSTWAGAVDTVGSNTLSTILRSTKIGGCVAACGLAGGYDLPISVYPFILRGVALQGIDTANIEPTYRESLWSRMANEWFIDDLVELAQFTTLETLDEKVAEILAGKVAGRTVVTIAE